MRFSDLKKKFPSLRVSVLVIVAFALLGSMMLPSISEKMGLDEGLCSGYEYYGKEQMYEDSDQLYEECVAEAEATYSSLSRSISTNCRLMNLQADNTIDEKGYDECVANAEEWIGEWYEEAVEDCEHAYLVY